MILGLYTRLFASLASHHHPLLLVRPSYNNGVLIEGLFIAELANDIPLPVVGIY